MNRHHAVLGQPGRLLRWSLLLLLAFAHPAWSAISQVGSTSSATGSGGSGSLALAYPAGLAAADILIAQIAVGNNLTIAAPAGWTLINRTNNGSALTQAAYWKRAAASNPASESWSFSASDRAAGTMVAYRDVDPVAPVNGYTVQANASSSSVTAGSLAPTVSGTQLVGLYALANGNGSFSPPTGMAEREDEATGGGPNGMAVELADEAYAGGTAATGTRVATSTSSAASIAHLVALQPSTLASYRMDEAAWSGSSGEVVDSSGRSHHASAANGAAPGGTTPALAGNPGTCNYGVFDGTNDHVAVPASFPSLATDFTITAWIRTTNNAKSGQRIFIDDQSNSGGYGFSLGDGGTGRLRFYARATTPIILDTANVIQNNTWYFVAAVADIVAKTKSLYVFNQAGTQIAYVTQTYTGTWGTDSGAASIGGENNASSESGSSFKFSGSLDEVSVFSGALSAAKLSTIMSQTRPCSGTPTATPSGFNAFETGTVAGSATGVIRTKIAASTFGLDVVALKSGGTAVETAFAGDVKLELVDASAGAGCGAYAPISSPPVTLTFTASDMGRKTWAGIGEPNAWPNARIRMTYPATGTPTIVACSTDNFAIRPASLGSVTGSDDASATAGTDRTLANTAVSGGNVHQAGRPFTLRATALNASGNLTANYSGSPTLKTLACTLPTPTCVNGILTPGVWSGSGTVTSTSVSYSEVGSFNLTLEDQTFASVDSADSSVLERTIPQAAAVSVGRFVPDHFVVTPNSIPSNTPQFRTFNETSTACPVRSFTYVGQPFDYLTLPQVTIEAKNAAGATTTNYAGALWKLAATDLTQTYGYTLTPPSTPGLDTSLIGVATMTSSNDGTGTAAANSADLLFFTRSTTVPLAPFTAAITLSISVADSSEISVAGNASIGTPTPALFDGGGSGIAFDSGNAFRYGSLRLSNAHGSELLGLPVPIETRYWNGAGFVLNVDDHCTQLAATHVALSNWQRNLDPCETSVTLFGRFNGGRGNLRFSAPVPAPAPGNTGSVDLTLQLDVVAGGSTCIGGAVTATAAASQSWLQGHWSGTPVQYTQNPSARASFGLHRGSKPLIYLREMW